MPDGVSTEKDIGDRTMSKVCNMDYCKHITEDGCSRPECSRRNDQWDMYEPKEREQ